MAGKAGSIFERAEGRGDDGRFNGGGHGFRLTHTWILVSGFQEKRTKARLLKMAVDGERVRDPTLLHHNER